MDPATSEIRVHEIWAAFDAGTVVQPVNLVAQLEGSLLFGMGVALYEQVNIRDGAADESNFGEYRVLRMSDIPEIHVSIIQSDNPPSGVGRRGCPPSRRRSPMPLRNCRAASGCVTCRCCLCGVKAADIREARL